MTDRSAEQQALHWLADELEKRQREHAISAKTDNFSAGAEHAYRAAQLTLRNILAGGAAGRVVVMTDRSLVDKVAEAIRPILNDELARWIGTDALELSKTLARIVAKVAVDAMHVEGVRVSGNVKPRHYTDEDHQAWADD